ncbi:hypothetical protein MKW98_010451 [Papaver atlanticum]|uniref:Uncharacterized protein n=1 Tax=Papaver atlanticum TaxID=357466 RepID=A0AAD4XTH2_9MAGN|nr:hypothetical protein MKW98_010451 [Papaver atlanticum]
MASMYASLTLLRGAVRDLVPPEIYQLAKSSYSYFFSKVQPKLFTIHIQQYEKDLPSVTSELLRLSKIKNAKNHSYTMVPKQVIEDNFNGIQFTWVLLENEDTKQYKNARGYYLEVSFEIKYKEVVNSAYLPHIIKEAEVSKFRNRGKKLYTNRYGGSWSQVCLFSHPSTFDTIALDPCLKKEIQDDLKRFVSRIKTSLIAAIANHLEFDVYDMELTSVSNNDVLRELLINTSSKSIIVVEDIDCSIHIENREKKNKPRRNRGNSVSLSGLLNFVDGLWSPCAGERLIIFTTNHKEKLDPALLRSGRMDKHILLSYCNMESFKFLAKNYLKLEEHELMIKYATTPADVAECLMSYDEDPYMGIRNVVEKMKKRLHSKNKRKEKDSKKKSQSDIKEKQKAKKKEEELDDSDESSSSDDSDNSNESTVSNDSDGYETTESTESDDESNELHFTDETVMAMNMMMI